MCLIAFTLGQNAHFPLVVAANRDEFFARPTAAMQWWTTDQGTHVLAGRDLKSGGTWLAVTPDGRIAAVTNVRDGTPESGLRSRGELPLLALQESLPDLQTRLAGEAEHYAGFNLVSLSDTSGWYYSNKDAHPGRHIHRGLYGLSNHLLQTPWPKLLRLRQKVGEAVNAADSNASALHTSLMPLLRDTLPAPDHLLPDTGISRETERLLSSPFVTGRHYGTRATTIVSISSGGNIVVSEQSWGPDAQQGNCQHFNWQR
jgi:uncharacterized protein with NRDE domain